MIYSQEINFDNIADSIWAGVIKNYNYDMLSHLMSLSVEVVDSGVKEIFEIKLKGIFFYELMHERSELAQWDFLELTEIYIEKKYNYIEVKCDIWSTCQLLIRCHEIKCCRVSSKILS